MSSNIMAADSVVLAFSDQQLSGKNAMVSSFEISVNNNLERLGAGQIIPRQQTVEISLDLVCSDHSMINWLYGKETNKISEKKVEDCTVNELLFAIRKKIDGK